VPLTAAISSSQSNRTPAPGQGPIGRVALGVSRGVVPIPHTAVGSVPCAERAADALRQFVLVSGLWLDVGRIEAPSMLRCPTEAHYNAWRV
jgi:hypothetical protein